MKPFGRTEKATFLKRPNRFTLICRLNGRLVKAFLPNPGRLWELLSPGADVHLERVHPPPLPESRMPYTVAAIQKGDCPVMVHTHRTNDLVEHLILENRIPGLEGAEIIRREISQGRSRFDFLLRKDEREILLEVKSCTLSAKGWRCSPMPSLPGGKDTSKSWPGFRRRGGPVSSCSS